VRLTDANFDGVAQRSHPNEFQFLAFKKTELGQALRQGRIALDSRYRRPISGLQISEIR
jgi:hypothetical protein